MAPAPPPDLVLRQQSMWWAFRYLLFDGQGRQVGRIDWPQTLQRTPQRGARAPGWLTITLRGRTLRVDQPLLQRKWVSDRRFVLGGDAGELACLDVRHAGGREGPQLALVAPVRGRLRREPDRWRWRYAIELDDGRRGSIAEPHWLSLRRELWVTLPRADDALRAFLGLSVLLLRTSLNNVRW